MNLLFCVIFSNIFVSDTLPDTRTLVQSLRTHYDQKTAAELAEYKIIEKSAWMKYLPQIGLQSGLDLIPRPTLTYSLSQIYNTKNDRERLKAKINAVTLANAVQFQSDSLNLILMIKKLKILRGGIKTLENVRTLEKDIFDIENRRFAAKLITDIELNEIKRKYLEFEQRYAKNVQECELFEIEVLKQAKVLEILTN